MPPDRSTPRQDPVSCQSCRQRKLKCNRQQPCANCQTRNVTCVYKTSEGAVLHEQVSSPQSLADISKENAEIKDRLRRIEHLLTARTENGSEAPPSASATPEDANIHRRPHSQRTPGSTTDEPTILKFQIVSVSEIATCFRHSYGRPERIPVPTLDKALALFEQWDTFIAPVHSIAFPPFLRAKIHSFYSDISLGLQSKPEDVALILMAFTTVIFYCHAESNSFSWFGSAANAEYVLGKWGKISFDLVWPPAGKKVATYETIQVAMHYYFLLHHMEGIQATILLMHSDVVAIAKTLCLHRIDVRPHKDFSQQAIIKREIGRRLWWHLCATDWQLAALPGPLEGTYSINPLHCRTNLPRNLTDDDLLNKGEDFNRPDSEATASSYMLQRIRLGEVCRRTVDLTFDGPRPFEPWEQPYDNIIYVDSLFEKMLQDMPNFLIINENGSQEVDNPNSYHGIHLIRNVANIMLWMRRLKVHLPYLDLAGQDERYAYSGQVCLQSAKRLLVLRESLKDRSYSDAVHGSRHQSMMEHLLHGVVIMLMGSHGADSMLQNGLASIRDPEDAQQDLEKTKRSANTFLDSLKSIIDEHEAINAPAVTKYPDHSQIGHQSVGGQLTLGGTMMGQPSLDLYSNGLVPDMIDYDMSWEQLLS